MRIIILVVVAITLAVTQINGVIVQGVVVRDIVVAVRLKDGTSKPLLAPTWDLLLLILSPPMLLLHLLISM